MDRLGKYEIRGILGRGAMGTVYEGWDPHIARRVAIKTVRLPDSADSEERELLDRFQKEAQAAGRLHHPNIVGVFDYAETDELAYIVMEFVEGRTLKALLDLNPAPGLEDIGHMMGGLLTGLAYSHKNEVIHRDIKPANVIVTPDGVVKIADFGIARIGGSGMTLAGTIMGTPAYMSPEQFRGTQIDSRTDIYSAGVLLFQLLTGKRPFEGNMATIMQAVLNDPAPAPSSLASKVSPALDAVVAQAMAPAPADRFPDAASFDQALQAALRAGPAKPALPAGLGDLLGDDDATIVQPKGTSPPKAAAMTPKPAPTPAAKSARMPLVLAGLAVLLLGGGGAGYMLLGRGPAETAGPPANSASTTPAEGTRSEPPAVQTTQDAAAQTQVASTAGPAAGGNPPLQATQASDPVVVSVQPPQPGPVPLAAIAAAVAQVACSAVSADEAPPGTLRLRGVATAGSDRVLRDAVQGSAPAVPADWQVATATGPYCGVLDALRPYINATGGVTVALADGRTALVKDELMVPRIAMPDFSAQLQLDYVSNDGGVVHLKQALPGSPYPPGATALFGRAEDKGQTYPVDEPYGTDLLIAIASSAPLFKSAHPQVETIDAYLHDLRAALDQASASGARLTASILLLRTALH